MCDKNVQFFSLCSVRLRLAAKNELNFSLNYHLSGVDLSLDDVEYGDVAVVDALVDRRRHHHVLRLKQITVLLKLPPYTLEG
jgi:hypothetical protein